VKEVLPLWIHLNHHFHIIGFELMGLHLRSCVLFKTRAFGIANCGFKRCARRKAPA
jgi:hypothetical protein